MQKTAMLGWVLTASLLLAPLSSVHATKLYKWVDEKTGQVHYSQTPPRDTQANEMVLRGIAPAKSLEATPEADDKSEEPADFIENLHEVYRQNCEIARQNLQTYQQSDMVQLSSGEVLELDETTRAAKVAEAQAMIDKFCR